MLNVIDLAKSYRSGNALQQVFNDLQLTLAEGEVVALLGASGSGKTTLLNLLSGIDEPDHGQVLLDNENIHALAEPARTLLRREKLGFVFQFFNLVPTLTVAENIALPMQLLDQPDTEVSQRVDDLLAAVGLPGIGSRFPETLSGGEQQRVAIARGLAHRPALLLADEPTGNLDETSGEQIIDLLIRLARQAQTTMLIVTHSRQVAARADRVLELHQGQLTAA